MVTGVAVTPISRPGSRHARTFLTAWARVLTQTEPDYSVTTQAYHGLVTRIAVTVR